MKKFYLLLLVFMFTFLYAGEDFDGVKSNPFGKYVGKLHPILNLSDNNVLLTGENDRGIFLYNLYSEKITVISDLPGAGRYISHSKDFNEIAFKEIINEENKSTQIPVIFSFNTMKKTILFKTNSLVGQPYIVNENTVCFTVDNKLYVSTKTGKILKSKNLNSYYNFVTMSSDLTKIAYSNHNEEIEILEIETGLNKVITSDSGYFNPKWSFDNNYLVFSKLTGDIYIHNTLLNENKKVGYGDNYNWLNNENSIIYREFKLEKEKLVESSIVISSFDGELFREDGFGEYGFEFKNYPVLSIDNKELLYVNIDNNDLFLRKLKKNENNFIINSNIQKFQISEREFEFRVKELVSMDFIPNSNSKGAVVNICDVPYHHQVYDTLSSFANGSSACGATSATMTLAYYNKLNDWSFVSSSPFSHTSYWGKYISETYSYGGHTFNIYGNGGYGGHGYIWQNSGEDTKGHMAEYISYHGVSSPSVDWSPTWAEITGQVNSRYPTVILNMLTTSGHYIVSVGYLQNQHTIYINDPYGNKNQGYRNYNGAGVCYDWPGYNNGYSNLNTVHCYIYSRSSAPITPGSATNPIIVNSFPFNHSDSTATSGGSDQFNYYSCSTANESGREKVYKLNIPYSGTLQASVECDNDVDIDIHLLDALDTGECITRAHIAFDQEVQQGTYYFICDTFVNSAGLELMGNYDLSLSLVSSSSTVKTK